MLFRLRSACVPPTRCVPGCVQRKALQFVNFIQRLSKSYYAFQYFRSNMYVSLSTFHSVRSINRFRRSDDALQCFFYSAMRVALYALNGVQSTVCLPYKLSKRRKRSLRASNKEMHMNKTGAFHLAFAYCSQGFVMRGVRLSHVCGSRYFLYMFSKREVS